MLKTASKILFLARVSIFENRDLPVITVHMKTLNRDVTRKLLLLLMYLLEKTTHPKLLKLGLYPSWVSIYRSDEGI